MSDYISRAAAIEAIENTDWYHINQNGELVSGANSQEHEPLYRASEIYAALEEVPSADVVEVVYCSECKHWNELLGICQRRQKLYGYGVNDYCSKGERRTDG